jgi:hypothetical protein
MVCLKVVYSAGDTAPRTASMNCLISSFDRLGACHFAPVAVVVVALALGGVAVGTAELCVAGAVEGMEAETEEEEEEE